MKVSTNRSEENLPCNCRKKEKCPLKGDYHTLSVVYKCEVSAQDQANKVYICLTEKEFKERLSGHHTSFNHPEYKSSTTLYNYVWKLKDQGIEPNFKWSIISHAKAYSNITKTCPLC